MRYFVMMCALLAAGGVSAAPPAVQSLLNDLQQRHGFPGASIAWVGSEGESHVVTGMADPQSQEPMTPESRMLAASIGKSFVSAAIVLEAMHGALDLDAPLATWLGDHTWFVRLPNHNTLTLRHLLNHSAGLPDHVYQPGFGALFARARGQADSLPTAQELVALILDMPPLSPVGEGWAYSDSGYVLAAMALEASLQKPWTEIVHERFLEPLALNATQASNHPVIDRLAVGMTSPDNDLGLPERTADASGQLLWHPGIEDAGGGLVSSAADLARWGRALWSGALLGEEGTRQLLAGVPVDRASSTVTYGLGVLIEDGGPFGEVRGHRGWVPGYVSSLRYYPAYDIAIAIQVNTDAGMMGETGVFTRIEAALTEAILPAGSLSSLP